MIRRSEARSDSVTRSISLLLVISILRPNLSANRRPASRAVWIANSSKCFLSGSLWLLMFTTEDRSYTERDLNLNKDRLVRIQFECERKARTGAQASSL